MSSIEWITPKKLVEILKSEEEKKTLVIDVRDDDFRGGNIKGALNIPQYMFNTVQMKELRKVVKKRGMKNIIFHCYYSQCRGPTCCQNFQKYCEKEAKKEKKEIDFEIKCLSGGYKTFFLRFSQEKELFDNIPELSGGGF